MVPFWGKQLLVRMALLAGLSAVLVLVIWSLSPGQASTSPPEDREAAQVATTSPRAGTPLRPEPTPAARGMISEAEAVAIAEKSVGGQAVKVDRQGAAAAPLFTVDVQRPDGKTSRVTMNASGSVIETVLVSSGPPARRDSEPESKGAEVRGTVRAVATDQRTITLLVREKGKEREATYRLASALRITGAKDATLTLADIPRGVRVRALRGDGDELVELKVEKKRRDD